MGDDRLLMELWFETGVPYTTLRETLTAKDFERARIYVREIGPIGVQRMDDRFATIVHAICQVNSKRDVGPIDDFRIKYVPKVDLDEIESMERIYKNVASIIRTVTQAGGGEVKEGPIETVDLGKLNLWRIKNGESRDNGG